MIAQIIYGLWLIALGYCKAPKAAFVPLVCNFIATLAVCGAMDLSWLDRPSATAWMMIIDFTTGVWLVSRPGLPRIVAMFYAVTLPIYAAVLFLALPLVVGFGVINVIAFVQLGVVTIDTVTGGGAGGGKRSRKRILGYRLAEQNGTSSVSQRNVAGNTAAGIGGLDGR